MFKWLVSLFGRIPKTASRPSVAITASPRTPKSPTGNKVTFKGRNSARKRSKPSRSKR
jgi:hypothetical protein